MSATDPPEETEFLRLDEDGKHARKVPIRVVSQPAETSTPNPVRIRVQHVSESEMRIMGAADQPGNEEWTDEEQEKVGAEEALADERVRRLQQLVWGIGKRAYMEPDAHYDVLRNTNGGLWMLITYLEGLQR